MHTLKLLTLGMFMACTAGVIAAESKTPPALGWLSGYWCSESGGKLIEEYWLPARGDPALMMGLSRTVKAGKTVNFEFLRITLDAGGANYLAQPQGVPPIAFRLTASGEGWARFENPQHDFPKRVEYRRTPGGLHAEIAGPGEAGKELVIPFEYQLCKTAGSAGASD
jgi:hypothetical protein